MTTEQQDVVYPMPFRIFRTLGFALLAFFILGSSYLGGDTALSRGQFFFAIGGAAIAIGAIAYLGSRDLSMRRLASASFLGGLLGTVFATVLLGEWQLVDSVSIGLGSGLVEGLFVMLAVLALRACVLSFQSPKRKA